MAIQFRKNCKICQAVKKDPKLTARIYKSKFYMGKGAESLAKISQGTGLRYEALLSHCKKHQAISSDALAEQQVQQIAKVEEKRLVLNAVRTTDARQDVIDKLMAELQVRDVNEMSARDVISLLLKATKDSDDVKAKEKDQELDIFKLMGSSRSGEVVEAEEYESFDPWDEADIEEGEVSATE